MILLGYSTDDNDEDLGNDDNLARREVADEGSKMEEVDSGMLAESVKFGGIQGTARSLLVAVRGQPMDGWWGHEVSESMDMALGERGGGGRGRGGGSFCPS